jgi:hypothetical protein
MGLKYNLFIAEGDPDRLLADMVKRGAVDETALMLADQKFDNEQLEAMINLSKDTTVPRGGKAKKFSEILEKKRPLELEAYNKRQREDFSEFSIWWMKAPFAPGWLVGGYTSYFFRRTTGGAISAGQLHEGLDIIYYVYYHHSSNEGIVIKSVKGGDPLGITLEPLKEETERFEAYIERIGKEHKVPVVELHNWIYPIHGAIQWTHEVTWKPKKAI